MTANPRLDEAMGKLQIVKTITHGYAENLLAEALSLVIEHLRQTASGVPTPRGRFVPSERLDPEGNPL